MMNTDTYVPKTMRACAASVGMLALVLGGLLWSITPASAADSGPTVDGEICMQKVFGTPVAPSNRVNCTANDISLSQVISVSPTSCIKGTTFDLEATFEVTVTANARYDAGFFFRKDGGLNARGDGASATGECSLSALTPPPPPNPPALNLDGDTCGDLNSGTYQVTFTIPDVECVDTDNDGKLNLPYCTSWHSNQGTTCDISEPFVEADAFNFKPDTKSKCVCDDNFEVPVDVEDAEISVEKTASPTQVPEPGGEVTYTVEVTNTATVESVIIETIDDDIYGDLTDPLNPDVTDNDCPDLVGETLGPGETLNCSFKASVSGNAGDTITDVVDVCASQPPSTEADICGDDAADVDITDVYDEPTLDKTAQATANCQLDASYQVVVSNNSEFDVLTVTALNDDMFGDITSVQGNVVSTDCSVPQDIDPLGNYTCDFTGRITDDDCDISHTNTVTANTVDDDDEPSSPSDDATVILTITIPTPTP
jgi:hypothetical protein